MKRALVAGAVVAMIFACSSSDDEEAKFDKAEDKGDVEALTGEWGDDTMRLILCEDKDTTLTYCSIPECGKAPCHDIKSDGKDESFTYKPNQGCDCYGCECVGVEAGIHVKGELYIGSILHVVSGYIRSTNGRSPRTNGELHVNIEGGVLAGRTLEGTFGSAGLHTTPLGDGGVPDKTFSRLRSGSEVCH